MEKRAKKLPSSSSSSSVQAVISNDDLLTEIISRLPALSRVLFKSVSKQWCSLIKHINPTLVRNVDPPSGLFLEKIIDPYDTDSSCFVSFDWRVPEKDFGLLSSLDDTNFTFAPEVEHGADILHSCNGLLLCCTGLGNYYICNPSITNMFKLLPKPDNVKYFYDSIRGGWKMAFDPTKSPHYKVIFAEAFDCDRWVRIHTYSSETGKWSLREDPFSGIFFNWFKQGVYWNDAIYWLNVQNKIFGLDLMNENPVLTSLPTPLTSDGKVHCAYSLFESRGCLLLSGKDTDSSQHFTIYEKRNVHSEWSVRYILNLVYMSSIFNIVLEEREEDSFLVMERDEDVVTYNMVSKTISPISFLEPFEDHDIHLRRCHLFIPSFAKV